MTAPTAANPDTWAIRHAAAIININMIHISPMAAPERLMTGAGRAFFARTFRFALIVLKKSVDGAECRWG